ncbi:MAG: amidohydrolase family protein [Planctomycetes bacterium]|nr:amidohydrolase family protein [Planctomycetota bacterium]
MVHRTAPILAATAALLGAALLPTASRAAEPLRAAPRSALPPAAASWLGGDPPAKLFVKAGRIWTGAPEGSKVAPYLSPGALLIVDGKVAEVAATLEAPPDAVVLDLGDAVVMPGLIDATTTLGGSSDFIANSVWKDDAVAAHFDPADSFDSFADWRPTLLGGVTTVYLSCGERRLVSGQGAVAKLASRGGGPEFLARQSALEINLGAQSLQPPARVDPPLPPAADQPILPAERQLPTTRVGQLLGVREAFARARGTLASGDLSGQALAAAVQARRPLRITADEAAELLRATQLARELGHPAIIVGAAEGALVADQLAAARYPVVVEIGLSLERPPAERGMPDVDAPRLRPESAAELVRRGVKVALATPPGAAPSDLLLAGAIALRGGLTTEQAVAALTRVPAELLGVGHRVGCLMPGKDADFVVLSGEPFLRSSYVQKVFVEGRLAAEPAAATSRATAGRGGGTVVIRGGTVLTGVGEPIRGGGVAIRDGRIVSVGANVAIPPGARIIDVGPDAVITPGFLDANSHLEYGEDRTNLSLDFDLLQAVAGADEMALEVARHGVTTALVQTWQAHQAGSRIVALKTAGTTRAARVVDGLAGVKMFWRGPFDPLLTAERYRGQLGEAKRYSDAWIKHAEELAKWNEEQKKKSAEQAAAEAAKAAEPKKDEAPAEVSKEKKADPVTGKWTVTVSGGPMPEPMSGSMNLKLDGDKVSGTFAALFGDEDDPRNVAGSLSGKTLTLEIDVDIPIGKPTIETELDADDHMVGKLKLGDRFAFDFSAVRTDKTFVEVVTVSKGKKKSADGRPAAPDLKPELEPFRRVFAGEIPILLECDSAVGIKHALKVFAEFKVEVVLLGADELHRLPLADWKGIVKGIVVPEVIEVPRTVAIVGEAPAPAGGDGPRRPRPQGDAAPAARPVESSASRERWVPAAEWSALGIPVAFQSNGITTARGLALNAAYAVRLGMDPRAALRALTIDPARMFHIEDAVGSLEPGKHGDVLVFSGDPFEFSSRLQKVFVAGEEIALEMKP